MQATRGKLSLAGRCDGYTKGPDMVNFKKPLHAMRLAKTMYSATGSARMLANVLCAMLAGACAGIGVMLSGGTVWAAVLAYIGLANMVLCGLSLHRGLRLQY